MRLMRILSGAVCALALALIVQSALTVATAHDFGGPTTGGGGDPPPGPPPPCDDACGCSGPAGSGPAPGGGGGGPASPSNRTDSPISFWNGSESLTDTDLIVNGVMPIVVVRKYDSLSTYDSPLGYGWSFAHDRRLYEYPDGSVVIRYGCGTRDRYVFSGGAYVSPAGGMLATLAHNGDGSWELRYVSGSLDQFDSHGRLTALQNGRGDRQEFVYDPAGKLPLTGTSKAAVTPNTPVVVAYNYRLTRIEERAPDGVLTGRAVNFEYEPTTGRLITVTADDGRSVSYQHDVSNNLTKGNLTQVNGLNGIVRVYDYTDPKDEHNLTSMTQAPGRTPVVNVYDDQGRVTKQTEGTRKIEFNYQTPLTKTVVTKTIVDENGLNPYTVVTTYEFDATGRITKLTDALGNEQRFAFFPNKELKRQEIWQKTAGVLSLLQAKNWTYDAAGHRLTESVTLDSGEVVTRTWTYDHDWIATVQVVSSAAPDKIFRTERTFFYDGLGQPKAVETMRRRRDDGSFQTTSYTYDNRDRLKTTTLPDGVVLVNEYTGDFVTRMFIQVNGAAIAQLEHRYEYDAAGNITKSFDARGNLTRTAYDDRRRLISSTDPLGEQTLYNYKSDLLDTVERGRTVADGEGQVTKYNYDARGRLIGKQRKDDSGTLRVFETYALDSEGQRLSVTDAIGRTTKMAYDVLGRQTSTTNPLNKITHFEYDAAGNQILIRDALGQEVHIEYDDLNRRRQCDCIQRRGRAHDGL
jgi:YD repeat-containing protein